MKEKKGKEAHRRERRRFIISVQRTKKGELSVRLKGEGKSTTGEGRTKDDQKSRHKNSFTFHA